MKQLSSLALLFVAAIAFAQNERSSVLEKCQQLFTLEARLQDLSRRYTQMHPEVVKTRREIEQLRTGLRKDTPEDACLI